MIKKFDEKFEEVITSELEAGTSTYEIVDKHEAIYGKNGKLYRGYIKYPNGERLVCCSSMIPYEQEKIMSDASEKAFREQRCIITTFPYIRLDYAWYKPEQVVVGDAYINLDTDETIEEATPQFFMNHVYAEDIVEGFDEIIETIEKHKVKAGSEFTVVFAIYPFADPYSIVEGDELFNSFVCTTKIALIKNPRIVL